MFGYDFGKIELSYKTVDQADIKPYERQSFGFVDEELIDFRYSGVSTIFTNYLSVQTDEGEKNVVFRWLPDDHFAMFEGENYAATLSGEPVAEGTYTYTTTNATLHFTKDELWNFTHQDLLLYTEDWS